jgi:hypothetical protein
MVMLLGVTTSIEGFGVLGTSLASTKVLLLLISLVDTTILIVHCTELTKYLEYSTKYLMLVLVVLKEYLSVVASVT